MIQTETQREKKKRDREWEKQNQKFQELWDDIKHSNISKIGIPESQKEIRKKMCRSVWRSNEQNVPKLMTDIKPQIQKFRDHHSVIFLYSNLVLYYNLASAINWETEIKSIEIQKEENKTICSNMIVCLENLKESTKKLSDLINELSGYKVNTPKSMVLLYIK